MLQFYFCLLRCCNFFYRDVAILFLFIEMLQFYFCLLRCCNFIFFIEMLQFYFCLLRCCNFIFVYWDVAILFFVYRCVAILFPVRDAAISSLVIEMLEFTEIFNYRISKLYYFTLHFHEFLYVYFDCFSFYLRNMAKSIMINFIKIHIFIKMKMKDNIQKLTC